jgi:hypothetical protein
MGLNGSPSRILILERQTTRKRLRGSLKLVLLLDRKWCSSHEGLVLQVSKLVCIGL